MPSRASSRSAGEGYWLTRFVFLRALGLIYLVAFLVLALQYRPLFGADGLLPARVFLEQVRAARPGALERFWTVPTLFWLSGSDAALTACAWLGVGLSVAAAGGATNALLWLALWLLYTSFVNVGQIFYGYGWEMMLLEAGFLAVFLCPIKTWRPFPPDDPPPPVVLWLVRWMLFRVMFGAGMIKLRGDSCWRELSCLDYHFETQPIPNPLSWYFHDLPRAVLHGGVLVNHFVELAAPWLLFLPGPARALAGLATAAFQGTLILSGNLSFLNYLTVVLCLPCFDDRLLARVLPRALTRLVPAAAAVRPPHPGRSIAVRTLAVVVGLLSVAPVLNLLSPGQAMNASFEPFHLVNTYGAFGSVGQRRLTVVLQGTEDAAPSESARWVDYQYKCQPVDVSRRPCWLSPYHLRLDWQAWFLPFGYGGEAWLPRLVAKLLDADPGALSLLAADPFAGRRPRWVRARLYEYRFARPGEAGWWVRTPRGSYLPPLSRGDPALAAALRASGFEP